MKKKKLTRGRMSRIEQMPPEIAAKCNELLQSGMTQVDVVQHLNTLLKQNKLKPISKSSLNRYTTKMATFGQRMKESREMANAWIDKLGQLPGGDVGPVIVNMAKTLAYEITHKLDEQSQGEDIKPAEILDSLNDLALLCQRLEKASELGQKRERQVRQEFAKQASADAEQVCKKKGVTPEVITAIRQSLTESVTAS